MFRLRLCGAALILCFAGCDETIDVDGGRTDAGGRVDSGPDFDAGGDIDAGPDIDAGGGTDSGVTSCGPAIPVASIDVEMVISGLTRPVFVTQAPGSTDTLWVVEKRGRIRLIRGGSILPTDFLDLQATIGSEPTGNDERGLLGLAFHPDYATNGRFFVFYTPTDADEDENDVIAEYGVMTEDQDRAETTEIARLVQVPTEAPNHNGGMLAFGSDGFLYGSMGDGGGSDDTFNNGQDTDTLLGTIVRLDVDAAGSGYAAAGNPFIGGGGAAQVWAYGLRNPWRFSFDRTTNEMFIADVGQDDIEEINIQPAASTGGENYGWPGFEGAAVFNSGVAAGIANHSPPALSFELGSNSEIVRDACSVTGGYVYRGTAFPALDGVYFYGDFCSGDVGVFRSCGGTVGDHARVEGLVPSGFGTSSFGQDNAGDVYIVNHSAGTVHRIVVR